MVRTRTGSHAQTTPLERQQLNVTDPNGQTFWHWVRFGLVAAVADRKNATEVIDVGAGSGMLGDWLSVHHPELEYFFDELSPTLDAALATTFGETSRHDRTSTIGPHAVVTLLDVIEHIEDDDQALIDLYDRLDAGTAVVVTVPAMQWAFSSWDTELGHFRRYSKKALARTLTGAGFTVTEIGYLFPEMAPLLPIRKFRRAKRDSVDFPRLGPTINKIGHVVSSTTARARRFWPIGTSVFALAEKAPIDG